jgi:lysophospholipase L1-like esterase
MHGKRRIRRIKRPKSEFPRITSGSKEADMRIREVYLPVFLTLCGPLFGHAAAAQTYYLALGDSLAVGYQPTNGGGPTDMGYADDLSKRMPGLSLTKLGCPGEQQRR